MLRTFERWGLGGGDWQRDGRREVAGVLRHSAVATSRSFLILAGRSHAEYVASSLWVCAQDRVALCGTCT